MPVSKPKDPCQRETAADRVSYAFGEDAKRRLLDFEAA